MAPNIHDAVVLGSGPNGLAAAITIAQAGRSVLLVESKATLGGGSRSAALTLKGFTHDVCSAVHPLAISSPFFKTLPLKSYGLEWIEPPIQIAHPFEDGGLAILLRSVDETARELGEDQKAYSRLFGPLARSGNTLLEDILNSLPVPRHPILMMRFAHRAVQSAASIVDTHFTTREARALLTGLAAHSGLELNEAGSFATALVLTIAGHGLGWPIPRGGAQKITDALAAHYSALGGEVLLNYPVHDCSELPPARAYLFDLSPAELIRIGGDRLPQDYRHQLEQIRLGPGIFKMDWALSGPIPWKAPECSRAGTVHLGGSMEDIVRAEREVWRGIHPNRPFILLSQPTLFDETRAPRGKHIAWAYCHVPRGSSINMTEKLEAQIERFAPGFRDLILARNVSLPLDLQRYNPNYTGGDITGGVLDLRQMLFRPVRRLCPYSIPGKNWYLCSASTPPGPGVHGMCGYNAAKRYLLQPISFN
ncbi:MAG: FAD-dependent oxidoreductase [Bdellovibrionales bacterium RIFOXYC1_FULL_54_43]|nr:MAG: FAD-dependent oxidoreductase [Bdellovibrionales bacterium RIFOXYC1_FULL_54_43]OFZ78535.1 MAG: FAD-dependent oxidoreductase [Bdellovibrionales bacterium RIFOXYD1_FULL_55_31]